MTDRSTSSPQLRSIGRPGTVHSGGRLRHDDIERVWRGYERDKTILRMQHDPVIGAILHGIEMLVRGVDWTVEAADDSEPAKETAEFVGGCLEDMHGFWPGDTLSGMLSYIPWGWAVQEIIYKRRNGPDATDAAHRSRYDDGRIGWRSWSVRPQSTREGWLFGDAGEPTALLQRDPQDGRIYTIPLDRCLHLVYTSKTNSPEGWTPLRPAFPAWYFKTNIQQIEAIGIERDLAGLPVAYYPAEWGDNDPRRAALLDIVTGIRNDEQAGIALQSVFDENGNRELDITLLSTGGSRSFDTDTIVRRYANELVTVFLANVMRTGQDGIGALALSETQSGLFQQAISAHLDIIGDAINTQAIPGLIRLNGIDQALTPQVRHGRLDSADLQNFGLFLVRLANTGLLLDTPELREYVHQIAGLPAGYIPDQATINEQRATRTTGGADPDGGA
jgi:hypothetical protein